MRAELTERQQEMYFDMTVETCEIAFNEYGVSHEFNDGKVKAIIV